MNVNYWEDYYAANPHPFQPSSFAMSCVKHITKPGTLIELGCGNGRDALFFSTKMNLKVIALDQCANEISRLNGAHASDNLAFEAADFSTYIPSGKPDYVYSRWTLHAVDQLAESATLKWVSRDIKEGGMLFIEARSINDGLYGKGTQVGRHAFFTDHYRRFLDINDIILNLEQFGFFIIDSVESSGLAVRGDDDPTVIRIVASKAANQA
jgi:tellurite methyltransferase